MMCLRIDFLGVKREADLYWKIVPPGIGYFDMSSRPAGRQNMLIKYAHCVK